MRRLVDEYLPIYVEEKAHLFDHQTNSQIKEAEDL
jgi:hypothetical protein